MREILFRNIIGYEDSYEISSSGEVFSKSRIDSAGRNLKPKRLKQQRNKKKYMSVSLSKNGSQKTFEVHRILMIAFHGDSKLQVDHIDGNPSNNNLSNLEYVTCRENIIRSKSRKTSSSNQVGVHWNKIANKWRSSISINGKQKHLGYFRSELLASEAYQNELRRLSK